MQSRYVLDGVQVARQQCVGTRTVCNPVVRAGWYPACCTYSVQVPKYDAAYDLSWMVSSRQYAAVCRCWTGCSPGRVLDGVQVAGQQCVGTRTRCSPVVRAGWYPAGCADSVQVPMQNAVQDLSWMLSSRLCASVYRCQPGCSPGRVLDGIQQAAKVTASVCLAMPQLRCALGQECRYM